MTLSRVQAEALKWLSVEGAVARKYRYSQGYFVYTELYGHKSIAKLTVNALLKRALVEKLPSGEVVITAAGIAEGRR